MPKTAYAIREEVRRDNKKIADLSERYTHAVGVQKVGLFEEAHSEFMVLLGDIESEKVKQNAGIVGKLLLKAAVLRQDGFTSLKHALRDNKPLLFDIASDVLEDSLSVTVDYLPQKDVGPIFDGWLTGELISAHASTESYMGRLTVARQVYEGEITLDLPATYDAIGAQHSFHDAHIHAKDGNRVLIGVENAIMGARAERVNGGDFAHRSAWQLRAFGFTAGQWDKGLRFDERKEAFSLAWDHHSELTNRENAMQAVIDWERV